MALSNKITFLIAFLLLGACFFLALFSIKNLSATNDEVAHISSGYSYLVQRDFRFNPEHPPLAKTISALPLLFLNLNFPLESEHWHEIGNIRQWDFGREFIFQANDNPDQIIFWSRVPMIILLIITGWFVFFWTRQLGGNKPALLALTLFAFSPAFLAHGRLVTTDIAATLGFLIGIYFWIKFLQNQTIKNFIFSAIALGLGLCFKFSVILILPILTFITLAYLLAYKNTKTIKFKKKLRYAGLLILVTFFAFLFIIWPVYQFHMANYPAQRQFEDIIEVFNIDSASPPKIISNNFLRPFIHYAFGFSMAVCRVDKGYTAYFLGTLSQQGSWWYYFPVLYLFKVPLALHLILLMFLGLGTVFLIRKKATAPQVDVFKEWAKRNFAIICLIIFFSDILDFRSRRKLKHRYQACFAHFPGNLYVNRFRNFSAF